MHDPDLAGAPLTAGGGHQAMLAALVGLGVPPAPAGLMGEGLFQRLTIPQTLQMPSSPRDVVGWPISSSTTG